MDETSSAPRVWTSRGGTVGEPAWDVALLFPPQGEWTEEEYLALDTNRMVELSDGRLEVLPMPTIFHQLLVKYLCTVLDRYVSERDLGTVLFAPLPVRLWATKYREPDIVFLRRDRARRVHGQPFGADLVMEVVSEGEENRERDLVTKRQEYAVAGISEYWIIDPRDRRVTVLTLDEGAYRVHGEFVPGATARSVLLPSFEVDVESVFASGGADQQAD
ncbi:MAG: Uma2 family endonuclease [Planctomycetes bacterium]|nr:Uma2 family endonuclease [Planctomycetota bacterium]MBL7044388.1 Uma2 family endonuclease [Pirellulaceae bacterium]